MLNEYFSIVGHDANILLVSLSSYELERPNSNILANIRGEYFRNGNVPKNKVTETWGNVSCKYVYGLSKGAPLRWKKYERDVLVEYVELKADHYIVESINPVDYFVQKRTYFLRNHKWVKSEFMLWNQADPDKVIKPHKTTDNTNLLLVEKGYEIILYPCIMPQNAIEERELRRRTRVPEVICYTDVGYFYYAPKEEAIEWAQTLYQVREDLKNANDGAVDENVDLVNGFNVDMDAIQYGGAVKIDISAEAAEIEAEFDNMLDSAQSDQATMLPIEEPTQEEVFVEKQPELEQLDDIIDNKNTESIDHGLTYDEHDFDYLFNDSYKPSEKQVDEEKNNDDNSLFDDIFNDDLFSKDQLEIPLMKSYDPLEEKSTDDINETYNDITNTTPWQVDKIISVSSVKKYYYTGDIENGNRHGIGRTAMESGRTAYEGHYKNDKRDGFGVYYYKTGKLCHIGDWTQNKRNGLGIAFNSSGESVLVGKWKDNEQVGTGVQLDGDGNIMFVGQTKDGKKNGVGISIDSNGSLFVASYKDNENSTKGTLFNDKGELVYNGEIVDGMPNGMGTSFDSDGNVEYRGNWVNGLYHGKGEFFLEAGSVVFKGDYKEGTRDGEGCEYKDGRKIYEGTYVDGLRNGFGNEYFNGELIYSGNYFDGVKTGYGVETINGRVYTGIWGNDTYNGLGVLYAEDGYVYAGHFKDGKLSGRANIVSNGIVVIEAVYKDGECIFIRKYSEDGQRLIFEGTVRDGVPNGMGREFSNNGEIIFEGIYKNGRPVHAGKVILKPLAPLEVCDELKETDYENFRKVTPHSPNKE